MEANGGRPYGRGEHGSWGARGRLWRCQTVDLRCQLAGQRGVPARISSAANADSSRGGATWVWHLPCWVGAFVGATQPTSEADRCHPAALEFLLFVSRDRARALRQRMMTDPQFRDVTVSRVYRVGSAWAVALCSECRST